MDSQSEFLLSEEEKNVDPGYLRPEVVQKQTSRHLYYLLFTCFIIAIPSAFFAGRSSVQSAKIGPVSGLDDISQSSRHTADHKV